MKARNIIYETLIRAERDSAYNADTLTLEETEIKRLFFSLNHILSEISEIVYVRRSAEAAAASGLIDKRTLGARVFKVYRVLFGGRSVKFKERPDFIEASGVNGGCEVEYYERLTADNLDSEIALPAGVDEETVMLGIMADICLTKSLVDESLIYEQKYKERLSRAKMQHKNVVIKSDRW